MVTPRQKPVKPQASGLKKPLAKPPAMRVATPKAEPGDENRKYLRGYGYVDSFITEYHRKLLKTFDEKEQRKRESAEQVVKQRLAEPKPSDEEGDALLTAFLE